ncbi:hypothetical protein [Microbacterium sp. H1-D42]|uniref:hypothetical protein n=1 Tax=Microbacterium sp. H1-D42 TaxID=2925844 RepID=UPI001F53CD91|nr:hypothetical protein [Microbacterium sp. H1-D42]UNK72248.1 hypothetical protein MNR00_07345 [Microbacterium sp. H1-D42]
MTKLPPIDRRTLLQLGGVGLGTALSAGVGLNASGLPLRPGAHAPQIDITDLGPGVRAYSLAGAVNVGNTIYIASRNIEPMQVIGYNLDSRSVTSVTPCQSKVSQALTASLDGRYVYVGVDPKSTAGAANLFRLDVSQPGSPREDVARIEGFNPLHMTTAPDGVVFMVGQGDMGVHQYDPAANEVSVLATPDPGAQWGRTVAASESTVYIGYRGRGEGGVGSAAKLFAVDRETGQSTSILPAEFQAAIELRDLAVIGETLVAVGGTAVGVGIAFIDRNDPTQYTIAQTEGSLAKLPLEHEGKFYFTGGKSVLEYDPAADSFRHITPTTGALGEMWDLFVRDGRLVITSGFGLVFEIDIRTGETITHDLVDAGAPADAQLAMSVTASSRFVYVGGNNAISRHDVRSGEVVTLYAPGEAKDAAIVDGKLFTGQYSGVGILRYDPDTDGQWPVVAALLPSGQNRPQDVQWDRRHRRMFVGSQSDTAQGGALMSFDPRTDKLETEVMNPFGDLQFVRQLYIDGNIAYLGGQLQSGDPAGTIIAWDLRSRREMWRIAPEFTQRGVTGLAVHGRHLYVMAYAGNFGVVDLRTRKTVHAAAHNKHVPGWGTFVKHRGQVYGASATTFYRFDKHSFALEPLVEDLGGEWYGMPRVSVDERGRFYAIRKRNLIRIDVRH